MSKGCKPKSANKSGKRAFPDWDVKVEPIGEMGRNIGNNQVVLVVRADESYKFICGRCGKTYEGNMRREDVATSWAECPGGDNRVPLAVTAAGGPKVYRCTRNTA